MEDILSVVDLIIAPIYLVLFFFIANNIRSRNIENNSSYRYYVPGLMVKMVGAIAICLVYVYYYGGGDTLIYHRDCVSVAKLFLKCSIHLTAKQGGSFIPMMRKPWLWTG